MANDYFLTLHKKPLQKKLATSLGLPVPLPLKRTREGWQADELKDQQIVLLSLADADSATATVLSRHLVQAGAKVHKTAVDTMDAIILDATTITELADLKQVFEKLQPVYANLGSHKRIVI